MPAVVPRAALGAVLAILVFAAAAEAGVSPFWRPLGTSASGNGVSQAPSARMVRDGSVAVGPDGHPVVAYTEHPSPVAAQGAIVVKRWTGSAWQTLGGAGGIGQGYRPQVRVAAGGAIHVAWLHRDADGNTEVRLRVRDGGSTFVALGTSDSPGGLSGANPGITLPFSLALDAAGNPYVAFLAVAATGVTEVSATPAVVDDTAQVYVRRWTGSAWQFVGSDFTGGGASNAVSFVNALGQTVLHSADTPALVIDSAGDPVVAFTHYTVVDGTPGFNTDVYVTRWDGAAWTAVGPAVPAGDTPAGNGQAGGVSDSPLGSFNPSLAAGPAGTLALAWEEDSPAPGTYVWVRLWNGVDAWGELAGSATDSGFARPGTVNVFPEIAVDADGNPVVAWQAVDLDASPQIFVRAWNGAGQWAELGFESARNAGISDAALAAAAPALALTPPGGTAVAGVPTVAWLDIRESGPFQLFLRQFYVGEVVPLTVTVLGDGRVASDPVGVACASGAPCVTELPKGTVVSLLPAAGPDAVFGAWAGACTGGGGCTVTLSAPRSVNASFVAGVTLAVEVLGAGGRVTSRPAGIADCTEACSARFAAGTTVTLTAAPTAGGSFTGWGGACAFRGTSTTCALPLSANTSVTAAFDLRAHTVTVNTASPPGAGVQSHAGLVEVPGGACDFGAGPCASDVAHGSRVVLSASPAAGNRFVSWAGGPCHGRTSATCEFTVTAAVATTALFRAASAVQVLKAGNGTGTVRGPGFDCGLDCTEPVDLGTSRTLTATPATGSRFVGWSGPDFCDGQAARTCTFVAAGLSQSVTATFELTRHRLAVLVSGAGTGYTVSAPAGIDCGAGRPDCAAEYDYDTLVRLTPVPDPDNMVVSWSGCTSLDGLACNVLVRGNRTVTLRLGPARTLEVAASGNGSGRIVSSPAGLTCVSNCSQTRQFAVNAAVVLTPQPAAGTAFEWVGGDDCSGRAACRVLMNSNRSATGRFTLNRHALAVVGRPGGTVASLLPDGAYACGSGGTACTGVLDYGTPVVLQATADPGFVFVRWAGVTCADGATSPTCAFALRANTTVTPTFRARTLLSVVRDGTGTGTVTGPGIGCGADCAEAVFDARVVTLTARPAVGSSFLGFGGDCVSNTSTCTFLPTGDARTVTATFAVQPRRLSVTVVGEGSVSGAGFTCDTATTPCEQDFDYGTLLPLTPTPAPGYRFTGWTGACTGTSPTTCRPLLTVARALTATFRPVFGLQVTRTGNSNTGGVTSSPAGINCTTTASDCAEDYLGGTRVTLTRKAPPTGTDFRWLGDCAFRGTNATCVLTLAANASVIAEYRLQELGLTVNNPTPTLGTVTRSGGALDCGATCFEVIDHGTPVTLVATPSASPAAEFVSWTGCTPTTAPACTFTLTANRSVSAVFRPLLAGVGLETLSTAPLAVGAVRQLTAIATFTDLSEQDVTAQNGISWAALPTGVATVSATGLVTGRSRGNVSIVATFRRGAQVVTSDPIVIAVDTLVADTPTTRAIVVTCAPFGDDSGDPGRLACLPSERNFEVHCRATGTFEGDPAVQGDEQTADITDQVTWVTSSATNARSTGLVAFQGPEIRQSFRIARAGTARLSARLGSRTSPTTGTLGIDPWVVQGSPQTPSSLEILPATPTVAVDGQVTLQALAGFDPTSACPVPPRRDFSLLVDWASEDDTVAEVDVFGEVTGVGVGVTDVTATYNGNVVNGVLVPLTATVPLTVTP